MKQVIEAPREHASQAPESEFSATDHDIVLQELETILASRFFKSAGRSRQFLSYVVQHRLAGHTEQLKERTIGAEVFQRPLGYATGDDPVVRVQAGEVRRRLEQYYQVASHDRPVRIELPVGSYSPVFHFGPEVRKQESVAPTLNLPDGNSATNASDAAEPPKHRRRLWPVFIAAILVVTALGYAAYRFLPHRTVRTETALDLFWSPIFATQQPVLICLAKPVAYRPNESVYRRYSRNHPGTFQTEAERTSTPLPLDPDESLTWGDFFVYSDYGVAGGDVYAAVDVSRLLGKLDKPSQLRIGSNYSYEDLRNAPAVVIGGFNNKWTMQLTSNFHFALIEDHEQYMIREQGPRGHEWRTRLGPNRETLEDYAIVSRLLDSRTGQFTVTVAGIGPEGTEAAGEFISSGTSLAEGLTNLPDNWQKRNLEVLLQTTVTDGVAGPPHVIATYTW